MSNDKPFLSETLRERVYANINTSFYQAIYQKDDLIFGIVMI
ncbi:MAG: hypothetical protein RMZ43_012410 [Nostoc sp. CmiVER01]|nr:hypothetical protein [Nostoc sp. CmiVER01]MDZ8120761.1 hypothetical protein [Nostoc sp. CmiVER01]